MNIQPIRTKTDYRAALKLVSRLIDADPIEAIKFRMEQSGLTVKDLEPVIGRTNRVYEVLSRRRPLSLRMIEGLHRKFGIPAESLLRQSAIVRAKSTA